MDFPTGTVMSQASPTNGPVDAFDADLRAAAKLLGAVA
jgi:hypothetical protein